MKEYAVTRDLRRRSGRGVLSKEMNHFDLFRTVQRVTPMTTPVGIHSPMFPVAIPSAVPTPVQIDMLTAKP